MLFIFLVFSKVISQCLSYNAINDKIILTMGYPYTLDLEEYFYGKALQYNITQTSNIGSIQIKQVIQSVNQDIQLLIDNVNIIDVKTLNLQLNQYVQMNSLSLLTSNNTAYQLYIGTAQGNGLIDAIQSNLSINSSEYLCFNQEYITQQQILIVCQNMTNSLLSYILFNITSNLTNIYGTELSLSQQYLFQDIQIYYNQSQPTFQQIFVFDNYSQIIIGNLSDLSFTQNIIQTGDYLQSQMGLDGTIFYLTSEYLLIQYNEQKNYLTNLGNSEFTYFQIQNNQNNTNIYEIILTSQTNIYYLLLNSQTMQNITTQSRGILSGILDTNNNLIQSIVLYNNRIIVFQEFSISYYEIIINLQMNQQIILQGIFNVSNQKIITSTINWGSNVIATFTNITSYIIQLQKPTIQFTQEQSNVIGESILNITAQSQINGEICTKEIRVKNINSSLSICPVSVANSDYQFYTNYPNKLKIYLDQLFVGPSLSFQVMLEDLSQSNLSYISYATNQYQNITFAGMCNIPDRIIQIFQYANYSLEIIDQENHQNYILANINSQTISISCEIVSMTIIIAINQQDNQILIYQISNKTITQISSLSTAQLQDSSVSTQIIQILLCENAIYIITESPNYLQVINIYTQNILFAIQDQFPRQMFQNRFLYPNLLFIDNTDSLYIIQFSGMNTYQVYNEITYPINNSQSVGVGLLYNGIYIALQQQSTNQSYLYLLDSQLIQPIKLYDSNSIIQIKLINSTFAYPMQSQFTNKYFYILNSNNNLEIYQVRGAPFNSLLAIIQSQLDITSIYLSSNKYQDVALILTSQDIGQEIYIKHFIVYEYQTELTQNYDQLENITINAISNGCSTQINQFINLINQGIKIQTRPSIQTTFQVNQTTNQIQISPAYLFNGSIQNYTISCQKCKTFTHFNPIHSYFTEPYISNYAAQGTYNQEAAIYLLAKSILYYVNPKESTQQNILFNISKSSCNYLFIEFQTQFPVAICDDLLGGTLFIAFNISQKSIQNITFTSNLINYFVYQNGIIQYIDEENQYKSAYFWINQNGIGFASINQINMVELMYSYNPLNMSMQQNITAQSCQQFGLIYLNSTRFYIINSFQCTPQAILLEYGSSLPPSIQQNWTEIKFLTQKLDQFAQILQLGYPKQNQYNELTVYFIISSNIQTKLFSFVINSQKISYIQYECNYYQKISDTFYLIANQEILMSVNYDQELSYQINLYANYFIGNSNLCQNDKDYQIPVIGYLNYTPIAIDEITQMSQLFVLNNYMVFSYQEFFYDNYTFVASVSDYLQMNVVQDQNCKITVIANNPYSSAQQTLYLNFQSGLNSKKWQIIVGSILGVFTVILIGGCAYLKYKKQQQQQQESMIEIRATLRPHTQED